MSHRPVRHRLLNSLYARLAMGLVILLTLLGGLYLVVILQAGRLYFQEVTQALNHTLAENLIAENGLQVKDGRFTPEALEPVFHTYMVVNPSIEVYLLDNNGRILAYSAPPGKVTRNRVDLAPVRSFLKGSGRTPIVGDDPRDRNGLKVFSAAPIGPRENPQGFLYVVLAGEQLESVATILQNSYILRLALLVTGGALLVGVLAGLWLLYRLTRRLRALDRAMTAFEAGGFSNLSALDHLDNDSSDEVGRLGKTFRLMAERITSQIDTLKQTDNLRRELVTNVSHDLRTPLASLQAYLETLLIKADTMNAEDCKQYVQVALRHSNRLGRLVTDLFELARLDSGHVELKREPFSAGELVQDVALEYTLTAHRHGVRIETDIPSNLPFVDADIGLIERVLENLLDNAIRHTPKGGQVTISLASSAGMVAVQVADSGCGIPAEAMPRVFDRFYQVERNRQDTGGGVGLGLAITRRILDLHASSIAVNSTPHSGTCFDFTLPACA